ncbi:hypothetical protein AAA799B03_00358 [Marine Group I thaumarchaeote SCGC AAA799-B03]|uniref:Uncharacterized protein n=3 Tax=Marine Group I TaxID=905826 RepID=A0A087S8G6_9ARCH|nr:hypothetical protein AAA799N04_00380 [Marine Group I thaumarchaeote SCGC AAA799-N04]KFM18046.1 hypothetical protein SCCGRSA3_01400 [Marine Group I thaumarchaeote SCGC RSA3]KFM22020.1 hypothetical protein AAA799B03_00358 [Marine Group I thaumarchaeote SCGC AAA799-B03]
MVTYNEYLKSILLQILESYDHLKEIQDKPGDLEIIKKELLKINGFLKVIANKIEDSKITHSDFKPLKSKFKSYLESYSFEQEIERMGTLYQDDAHRVKNMRLKILESLNDNKMIEDVKELIEKI